MRFLWRQCETMCKRGIWEETWRRIWRENRSNKSKKKMNQHVFTLQTSHNSHHHKLNSPQLSPSCVNGDLKGLSRCFVGYFIFMSAKVVHINHLMHVELNLSWDYMSYSHWFGSKFQPPCSFIDDFPWTPMLRWGSNRNCRMKKMTKRKEKKRKRDKNGRSNFQHGFAMISL
jgi:hypothetical protein